MANKKGNFQFHATPKTNTEMKLAPEMSEIQVSCKTTRRKTTTRNSVQREKTLKLISISNITNENYVFTR